MFERVVRMAGGKMRNEPNEWQERVYASQASEFGRDDGSGEGGH